MHKRLAIQEFEFTIIESVKGYAHFGRKFIHFYRTSIVWITKTGGYAVVCSSLKAESRKLSLIDSIQILTFDKRFFLK